jgi:hypothetical protein
MFKCDLLEDQYRMRELTYPADVTNMQIFLIADLQWGENTSCDAQFE